MCRGVLHKRNTYQMVDRDTGCALMNAHSQELHTHTHARKHTRDDVIKSISIFMSAILHPYLKHVKNM